MKEVSTDQITTGIKHRVAIVRLRTWVLTIVLLLALILYVLIQVTFTGEVNFVDLALLGALQIVIHCLYFPDGDLYGQQNETFINNKKAYNEKAVLINENRKIEELREYCKIEFQMRKKTYLQNLLGILCITEQEYEQLKQKSPKEIKGLEKWEHDGKLIFFTRKQRKILYNLLFKEIPVEENSPETILSAVEINYQKKIKDQTSTYKTAMYVKRILKSTVVAIFIAYLGFEARDGISFSLIVKMVTYIASLMTTAVLSFSAGENCSKIYKNNFYIELSNFIDGFSGWLLREKQFDLKR